MWDVRASCPFSRTITSPGSDVPQRLAAHQFEGDRFARHRHSPLDRPDDQRPDPERVAESVDLPAGEQDDRVAPDDLGARASDRGLEVAGPPELEGDHLGHRLGVGVAEQVDPLRLETAADPFEIDDVAVVRDRGVLVVDLHDDRLGVLEIARAGRGVANVPDPDGAAQSVEHLLGEDLVDEAHSLSIEQLPVAARADAGGLLSPVLERPQAPEEVRRRSLALERYPDHSTLLSRRHWLRGDRLMLSPLRLLDFGS